MAETMNGQSAGLLQRVLYAAKYAITGAAPADWFGPLAPLPPQAPPDVKGRQFDYPVGINLNYVPRSEEPIGFAKLKALAKNCDTLRIVIEGQKDKLEALEWSVKPRVDGEDDTGAAKIQSALESPDGNLDWSQWLRALLDQLLVLDAVSIYRRKTLGGAPYSFEILDGATIKVLLDQGGRPPASPAPAYQQILKGIVAADFTREELLYYPQNVRADHAYGYSRVEQIVSIVETSIERMKSQKGYFTHGNLSDGFFEAPDGATPNDIRQIEEHWNTLLGMGAVENKRIAPFLPAGFKFNAIKEPPLQEAFDEWLIRLICFTFSTSPQPFLKSHGLGNGGQETQHQAAEAAGMANIMAYIRRVMNRVIRDDFGRPDLEFSWVEDREFDPQVAATIQNDKLKTGTLTINEARDRDGLDPIDGGDVPLIYIATGAVRVVDVTAEPAPAPVDPNVGVDLNAPPGEATPPEDVKKKPDLTKAAAKEEKALADLLTAYLAAKGTEISRQLGDVLGLQKAAPSDDSSNDFSGRIDHAMDGIDWGWADLIAEVEPTLTGLAVAAGKKALDDLKLFDAEVLKKMTADATAYAEARAAEMVGRKMVDGELVENEGWSIPAATRDMIRSAVTKAMEEGQSNPELAKTIRESDAFSTARAETIARTETAKADVQGTIAGWKESGLVGGKQWLVADGCCDECQALDGEIVALDDEFDGGDPPLHPNCLPGDTLVLAAGITGTFERPYDGNVVVIGTASGKRLTCTPNHPILTPSGWVAAARLNVGGHVISSRLGDGALFAAEDGENVPARIEDVAKTFRGSSKVATVPVPVAAPHFHGDGEGSEIAIVGTNRLLMDRADPAGCKHCGKPLFFRGDVEALAHDGAGASDLLVEGMLPTSGGFVDSGELEGPRRSINLGPCETLGLTTSARRDAELEKSITDRATLGAEMLGASLLGQPRGVETSKFADVHLNLGAGSDAALFERRIQDMDTDTCSVASLLRSLSGDISADGLVDFVRRRFGPSDMASVTQGAGDAGFCESVFQPDLAQRLSTEIFLDHIVDVRFDRFAGHVYNLETKSGFYVAEGIVTHNCECSIIAVLTDEMPADDTEE